MSDRRIHVRFNFSPNELRAVPEQEPFDTGYFSTQVGLGYEYLLVGKEGGLLGSGGILPELGYSYVGGDEGNLGSRRHQGEFRLGWNQRFGLFKTPNLRLFVTPMFGLGLGNNSLNFGGGLRTEGKFGSNWQIQGTSGLEFCFNRFFCGAGGVGYFDERSFSGPSYENRGILFGFQIALDPRPEPEKVTEVVERERRVEVHVPGPVPPEEPLADQVRKLLETKETFLYLPVLFEHGNWHLNTGVEIWPGRKKKVQRHAQLDTVAAYLKENLEIRLRLDGYANDWGDAPYNRVLSLMRALEVQKYLVQVGGISEGRLVVEGRLFKGAEGKWDAEGASVHGAGGFLSGHGGKDEIQRRVHFERIAP